MWGLWWPCSRTISSTCFENNVTYLAWIEWKFCCCCVGNSYNAAHGFIYLPIVGIWKLISSFRRPYFVPKFCQKTFLQDISYERISIHDSFRTFHTKGFIFIHPSRHFIRKNSDLWFLQDFSYERSWILDSFRTFHTKGFRFMIPSGRFIRKDLDSWFLQDISNERI
jgi:hypothetical protein